MKLSDFSASNMQLFFLSGPKRLLWSEVERFLATYMQLFFLSGSKRLLWSEVERFLATYMQLFFPLRLEEAAFWTVFD